MAIWLPFLEVTSIWGGKCHFFVIFHIKFAFIRGAFGKFLAWYFISVTDLQTLLCLISF